MQRPTGGKTQWLDDAIYSASIDFKSLRHSNDHESASSNPKHYLSNDLFVPSTIRIHSHHQMSIHYIFQHRKVKRRLAYFTTIRGGTTAYSERIKNETGGWYIPCLNLITFSLEKTTTISLVPITHHKVTI